MKYLFIIVGYVFDLILNNMLAYDYSFLNYNFIFNIAILNLLLLSSEFKLQNMIFNAVILGLFQDLASFSVFGINIVNNILILSIYYFWNKNVSDTVFETTILFVLITFICQFNLFFINALVIGTNIKITTFVTNTLFTTLIINAIFIPIMIIVYRKFIKIS